MRPDRSDAVIALIDHTLATIHESPRKNYTTQEIEDLLLDLSREARKLVQIERDLDKMHLELEKIRLGLL